MISVSGSSSALLSTRLFAPARSSSPYFIAAFSFVICFQRRWEMFQNIKLFDYEDPLNYWWLKQLHVLYLGIQAILWKNLDKTLLVLFKMIFECHKSNINYDSNEPIRVNILRSTISYITFTKSGLPSHKALQFPYKHKGLIVVL